VGEPIRPRRRPCPSCPYRRDVPSGLWDTCEYDKLCLAQSERVLAADLRWIPVGDIRNGDILIGFEAEKGGRAKNRRLMPAAVTYSRPARAECVRVILSDDTSVVCTVNHPWLAHNSADRRSFVEAQYLLTPRRPGGIAMKRRRVVRLLDTWKPDESRDGGWLAGMYDGEGHLRERVTDGKYGIELGLSQNPGPVLARAEELLSAMGVKFHRYSSNHATIRIDVHATAEVIRILGILRPIRLLPKLSLDRPCPVIDLPEVVDVEPVGEQEIQLLSTATKTYIGEGFAMHNSSYDGTTADQATTGAFGAFFCHTQDGNLCAGWVGCHDMNENLAIRVYPGELDYDAIRGYRSPVALFGSGAEAAEHGKRDINNPGARARRKIQQLSARRDREAWGVTPDQQ
jgi:uncharacterized protein DUF6283